MVLRMGLQLLGCLEGQAALGTAVLVDVLLGHHAALLQDLLHLGLLLLLAGSPQLLFSPGSGEPVAAFNQTGQLLQTIAADLVALTCMLFQ